MATFIRVARINTGDTNNYTLSLHDIPNSATQETPALHSVAVQPARDLQREMIAEIAGTPSALTVGETYAVRVVRDSDGFNYASGYTIYRDGEESPSYASVSDLQTARDASRAFQDGDNISVTVGEETRTGLHAKV